MDTKYKQIITKLNTNYTKSPNIIKLWQIYLQIKYHYNQSTNDHKPL